MSLDLNRMPDKIIVELNQLDDVLDSESTLGCIVAQLIRKAYTEGLTLGLASAHDKILYEKIVDYIVPEE